MDTKLDIMIMGMSVLNVETVLVKMKKVCFKKDIEISIPQSAYDWAIRNKVEKKE